jgi:hypothetical protein
MNDKITTLREWNIYQILIYSAQTVEFSMSSFPEHKPALFKKTVGNLAFAAFSAKGKMTHDLSEAIPGAPLIKERGDMSYAYQRLKKSAIKLKGYRDHLAEHFDYGNMSKQQYEQAHAMRFYNHLLAIKLTS